MQNPGAPRKPLPSWVEPALILLVCFTAALEWSRGEACWAIGFAAIALIFSISAVLRRLTARK